MMAGFVTKMSSPTRSTRDLAPEDAAARVNDVLKAMVDAVLAYDGRINRLLGDAVLAFFGTPVAHENDPERAILAALRIRESVQRLGFDVTVGINTSPLAGREGDKVQITNGVRPGEEVVIVGGMGVDDKAKVHVITIEEKKEADEEEAGPTEPKGGKDEKKSEAKPKAK